MANNQPSQPLAQDERIIRMRELRTKTGLCPSYIYRLINMGEFPKQIKLTGNGCTGKASGWLLSEVNAWLEQRIAESRQNSAA